MTQQPTRRFIVKFQNNIYISIHKIMTLKLIFHEKNGLLYIKLGPKFPSLKHLNCKSINQVYLAPLSLSQLISLSQSNTFYQIFVNLKNYCKILTFQAQLNPKQSQPYISYSDPQPNLGNLPEFRQPFKELYLG